MLWLRVRTMAFDHVAGLGHPGRNRRLVLGRDGDADPGGVNLREDRVALVFVDDDEPAGIDQPSRPPQGLMPAKAGSIMACL